MPKTLYARRRKNEKRKEKRRGLNQRLMDSAEHQAPAVREKAEKSLEWKKYLDRKAQAHSRWNRMLKEGKKPVINVEPFPSTGFGKSLRSISTEELLRRYGLSLEDCLKYPWLHPEHEQATEFTQVKQGRPPSSGKQASGKQESKYIPKGGNPWQALMEKDPEHPLVQAVYEQPSFEKQYQFMHKNEEIARRAANDEPMQAWEKGVEHIKWIDPLLVIRVAQIRKMLADEEAERTSSGNQSM